MSPENGFLSEGKVIPCSWTAKAREPTSCGKPGARNLEAERIRSRAESTGGRGKLLPSGVA